MGSRAKAKTVDDFKKPEINGKKLKTKKPHPGSENLINEKIYKTPEALLEVVNAYFDSCVPQPILDQQGNQVLDKNGLPIYENNPITVTGLILALGFKAKQTLYNYKTYPGYADIINYALLRCENTIERGSINGKIPPAMGIFLLSNYGWKNKQETEITGDLPFTINIIGK